MLKSLAIVGPLVKLLGSQKFIILAIAIAGVFALVGFNRITWEQAVTFLTVTLPAWALAHGIQDGLKAKAAP